MIFKRKLHSHVSSAMSVMSAGKHWWCHVAYRESFRGQHFASETIYIQNTSERVMVKHQALPKLETNPILCVFNNTISKYGVDKQMLFLLEKSPIEQLSWTYNSLQLAWFFDCLKLSHQLSFLIKGVHTISDQFRRLEPPKTNWRRVKIVSNA